MNFSLGPLAKALDESSQQAQEPLSFFAPNGSEADGVLVIHGFTGSPVAVATWARTFADAGYHVELPLLPGHGTSAEDLTKTSYEQWLDEVLLAYDRLAARSRRVAVAGLSMGATLALAVTIRRPVASTVLVNPAVVVDRPAAHLAPLLKHVVPFVDSIGKDIAMPGRDERAYPKTPVAAVAQLNALLALVRKDLGSIESDLLVFVSETDHVISARSLKALQRAVPNRLLTVERLKRSFHVATMDYDAPRIFEQSLDFIAEHFAQAPGEQPLPHQ